MAKTFKKNQAVIATLPDGRKVEGYYIEPYGTNGHSLMVDEFDGYKTNGEPRYSQKRYGVSEEFIEASTNTISEPSETQYKAWLKRAMDLENRIKADSEEIETLEKMGVSKDAKMIEKLQKKVERSKSKLEEINKKIDEYEGEE